MKKIMLFVTVPILVLFLFLLFKSSPVEKRAGVSMRMAASEELRTKQLMLDEVANAIDSLPIREQNIGYEKNKVGLVSINPIDFQTTEFSKFKSEYSKGYHLQISLERLAGEFAENRKIDIELGDSKFELIPKRVEKFQGNVLIFSASSAKHSDYEQGVESFLIFVDNQLKGGSLVDINQKQFEIVSHGRDILALQMNKLSIVD